ncbi:hypothetical protein SteCoe_8363 [Stentor coeruleus]|uniref:Uncharacterized protein n=1 Tax=Stentor coeruleus TaxID=5963 RepID=A0A1R2CKH5_9CILI|nr:hypothetical protein SteCoe_8363 [Stentor coeruleus]
MFLYGFALLLPYTLIQGSIYIGLTFINGFTYIILGGCFVVIIISLEVVRFIKIRKCCPKDTEKGRRDYISQNQDVDQSKYIENHNEREEKNPKIDENIRDNKDNEHTSFQFK